MNYALARNLVNAAHQPGRWSNPDNKPWEIMVLDYCDACSALVDFHREATLAFATALAPAWLGQEHKIYIVHGNAN